MATRLHAAWVAVLVFVLAGCSTAGESFRASQLGRIVQGRTTLAQASQDLGAEPVNTWQQGDTLLARWAYRGTVATDAVYFRQEAWLRFGPDGRFLRTENTINVPPQYHTLTAEEATQRDAKHRVQPRAVQPAGSAAASDQAAGHDDEWQPPVAMPVAPPVPVGQQGQPTDAPLLPVGTQVLPGATYPVNHARP